RDRNVTGVQTCALPILLLFELLALFIVVSFIVSLIQQVVSEDKIQKLLSKPNKATNYVLGMIFCAITPFCSCSTIPILAGLLNRSEERRVGKECGLRVG